MTKCIQCGKELSLPEEVVTIEGRLLIGGKEYLSDKATGNDMCLFCFLEMIEKAKQDALNICSNRIAQLEAERLELSQKYEELSGEKHNSALDIPEFLQK